LNSWSASELFINNNALLFYKKEENMKKRNPILVAVISIITVGIYGIVWFVKTIYTGFVSTKNIK